MKNYGLNDDNDDNNYNYNCKYTNRMAKDCRILKGITIMMFLLLMKVCIESSQDISFVFFNFWIAMEGIQSTTLTKIPNLYFQVY